MNINIICTGKIKETYLRDAIEEYKKRISRFSDIKITEVQDEKDPKIPSPSLTEKAKEKEGKRIIEKIPERSFVTALCINGTKYDSLSFAEEISQMSMKGMGSITFIIGGSNGLSDEVIKRADSKISFSDMTFPHQLMRVILLEQIYRAFKILNNEPYHK